ncbi:MAG: LuxR C-terminal-related transcriptional regulator [Actinomycetota bacterium]
MDAEVAARVRLDLARIAHNGQDWVSMTAEMGAALSKVIPFDFHAWHPLDPATLIMTGVAARETTDDTTLNDPDSCRWLAHCEYAIDDVIQWEALAKRSRPSGILSHATKGKPETSPRYRQMLKPAGFEGELRAVFVSDRMCWAALSLCRTPTKSDFDTRDADFVATASRQVADGFRRSVLFGQKMFEDATRSPAMIVIDRHGEVEAATPSALSWLDDLIEARPHPGPLPVPIEAVALRARYSGTERLSADSSARARVRTRSGRWVTLYGVRLQDATDSGRIGIVIEPTTPLELAPFVLSAYGLTKRERQVARHVISGMSTRQISHQLSISLHTVQDHLKAIFRKVGVSSRRDLVAKVFFEDYRPLIQ